MSGVAPDFTPRGSRASLLRESVRRGRGYTSPPPVSLEAFLLEPQLLFCCLFSRLFLVANPPPLGLFSSKISGFPRGVEAFTWTQSRSEGCRVFLQKAVRAPGSPPPPSQLSPPARTDVGQFPGFRRRILMPWVHLMWICHFTPSAILHFTP